MTSQRNAVGRISNPSGKANSCPPPLAALHRAKRGRPGLSDGSSIRPTIRLEPDIQPSQPFALQLHVAAARLANANLVRLHEILQIQAAHAVSQSPQASGGRRLVPAAAVPVHPPLAGQPIPPAAVVPAIAPRLVLRAAWRGDIVSLRGGHGLAFRRWLGRRRFAVRHHFSCRAPAAEIQVHVEERRIDHQPSRARAVAIQQAMTTLGSLGGGARIGRRFLIGRLLGGGLLAKGLRRAGLRLGRLGRRWQVLGHGAQPKRQTDDHSGQKSSLHRDLLRSRALIRCAAGSGGRRHLWFKSQLFPDYQDSLPFPPRGVFFRYRQTRHMCANGVPPAAYQQESSAGLAPAEFCAMTAVRQEPDLRLETLAQPFSWHYGVLRRPSSSARWAIASITNWMCSSSSTPRSAAPRAMSSRLTAAAKPFCLSFFFTLLAVMPTMP